MSSRPSIAIIGGGPCGLTLLLTLHRRGIAATLYERDNSIHDRAHLGGTLDLGWDSGQRAFRDNGLSEVFKQHSRPEGDEYRLYDHLGNLLLDIPSDPSKAIADLRPEIDRKVLRKLLIDACPADSIQWGHALVSARAISDGPGSRHELTFANGQSTVCDLLIGADGANSRIRPLVSSAVPYYTGVNGAEISLAPSVLARAEMADVRAHIGSGTAFATSNSRFLFSQRNGDGRVRTYAWFRAPQEWTLPKEASAARQALLEMYVGWHPTWLKLIEHCDEAGIYPRPLWQLPPDHRWKHVAGVTLVGDAAHLMNPFAGAGANVGMLGAVEMGIALAEAISSGKSDAEREAAIQAHEERMFVTAGAQAALSAKNLDEVVHPDAPKYMVERTKAFLGTPGARDEAGSRTAGH